jgi:serine/threonine protein kinase
MRVCPTCFSLFGPDQLECPKDSVPTQHYTEVLVGMNLGPYVVRSLISEGGMGVVYAGEHPTLGRRVALKVLRPELSLRDDIVERFTQEARAVNTIGHANIVNIYDFGRTPFGTFYIVMEYLEGRTLRQLLDLGGPQPLERVCMVVREVGAALESAHSKGFIHRDVKPENIMMGIRSGSEWVKLLDFGIAKLLTGNNTTATSGTMGTPQYMSPEQLDDGKVDHRSDIYALGGVIYELLTGQVPYAGSSHAAVRQAQLTRRPPPAGLCRKDIHISTSLDEAILRCMALEPDFRFQHLEDFLSAFNRGVQDTLEERNSGITRNNEPKRPWKVFALSGVFAVVLGTVIALTLLHFMRNKSGSPKKAAVVDTEPARKDSGARKKPTNISEGRAEAKRIIDEAFKGPAAEKAARFAAIVRAEPLRKILLEALKKLSTRSKAASALGELPPTPETIAALRKVLVKSSGYSTVAVAQALGELGKKTLAAKVLTRIERTARNSLVRQSALRALAPLSPSAAKRLEKYERARGWEWPKRRAPAIYALASSGNQWAKDELRRTIMTAKPIVRLLAADQYLKLSDADKQLVRTSLGKLDKLTPLARAMCAGILARLGDANAAKTLVECLSNKESGAKTQCALELGRLRGHDAVLTPVSKAAVTSLLNAISSESADLKLAAAISLQVLE